MSSVDNEYVSTSKLPSSAVNAANTPNINISNPLDSSGNVKVSVENTSSISISSPLDASGNVKVYDEALPVFVKIPLNQDGAGNVGVQVLNSVINTRAEHLTTISALQVSTSPTPNTPTQLANDPNFREEVLLYAPPSNTAPVLIGPSDSVVFPILPNTMVKIKWTQLSLIYIQSTAASQTLYVLTGGS